MNTLCKNCVFAVTGQNRNTSLWFCSNSPEKAGQLVPAHCRAFCENHRPKILQGFRLKTPAPPNDQIRYIALTKGKFAIVDLQDYLLQNSFKWCAVRRGDTFYAMRNVRISPTRTKSLFLHREIMKPPKGFFIDHINGNPLDDRRANLRLATPSQNMFNRRKTRKKTSSRFVGVCFDKYSRRWRASICSYRKTIHLGYFHDEIEAAKAYDAAAKKYHGEFAKLNFPKEIERSPKPREIQRISGTKVLGIPKHRDSRGRLNLRLANWLGARLNFPEDTKAFMTEKEMKRIFGL